MTEAMQDDWTDRLSDYLDDELTPPERAALEAHLAGCARCSETLAELREVVARAATLPARPPAADSWPAIDARLVPPARRFSFTMPQLVAAGLALMVMSGSAVWVLQHGGRATDLPRVAATSELEPSARPAALGDPHYDDAVADLEQALDAGRAQLDPDTIKILERNLEAIDAAIDQSRRALATDPANVYLHNHLAETRQLKLALLRRGVGLLRSKS
jgi:hypothetical protein